MHSYPKDMNKQEKNIFADILINTEPLVTKFRKQNKQKLRIFIIQSKNLPDLYYEIYSSDNRY